MKKNKFVISIRRKNKLQTVCGVLSYLEDSNNNNNNHHESVAAAY